MAGPGSLDVPAAEIERDGLGRPVALRHGSLQHAFAYDAQHRLTSDRVGGSAVECRYDDAEGFWDLIYPDGRTDRYQLDELGRLSSVVLRRAGSAGLTGPGLPDGATVVSYAFAGPVRVTERRLANGTRTRFGYDSARRMTSVEHLAPSGDRLASVHSLFDAVGRRVAERFGGGRGLLRVYGYDALSRLIEVRELAPAGDLPASPTQAEADRVASSLRATRPSAIQQFRWSPADSCRAFTVGGGTASVSTNPLHQIARIDTTPPDPIISSSLTYESGGARVADHRFRYTYDALGRLRRVHDAVGALRFEQDFDGVGRVITRRGPGGETRLHHFGERRVQESDPLAGARRQWTFGAPRHEVVLESGPAQLWRHADVRFSVLALSDGDGAVLERFRYAPFGTGTILDPAGNPLPASRAGVAPSFTGHDAVLPDLYDARARLYDSRTLSFLHPDPEGFAGSPNPYAWASLDPINRIDPGGDIPVILAVGAVIGAVAFAYYALREADEHPQSFPTEWTTSWRGFGAGLLYGVGGAAVGMASAYGGELVLARFGFGSLTAAPSGIARMRGPVGLAAGMGAHALSNVVSGSIMTGSSHAVFPRQVQPLGVRSFAVDMVVGTGGYLVGQGVRAIGPAVLRSASRPLDRWVFEPLRRRMQQEAETAISDLHNVPWFDQEMLLPPGAAGATTMNGTIGLRPWVHARMLTPSNPEIAETGFKVFRHELGHRYVTQLQGGPFNIGQRVARWRPGLLSHSEAASYLDEAFAQAVSFGSTRAGLRYADDPGHLLIHQAGRGGLSVERLTGLGVDATARTALTEK